MCVCVRSLNYPKEEYASQRFVRFYKMQKDTINKKFKLINNVNNKDGNKDSICFLSSDIILRTGSSYKRTTLFHKNSF